MTKLLEQAVASVQNLPEAEQDEAAEMLLSLVSRFREPVHLDSCEIVTRPWRVRIVHVRHASREQPEPGEF